MALPTSPVLPLLPSPDPTAQAPAAVALATGQRRQEDRGSARWPLEPDGPAQTPLRLLLQAAHALGHTVPEHLVVRAGQLFYREGVLEEVRLAGVLPGTPTDAGDLPRTAWSTPTPPTLQEGPDGTVLLRPADAARPHYAVLVVRDAAVPQRFEVACVWHLPPGMVPTAGLPLPPLPLWPKQPAIPTAFPDDRGRLPNNPLIAAGMAALWKGGPKARHLQAGWQDSPTGTPIYQHTGRTGGRILVYPALGRSAADPLPTPAALWDLVEQYSPLTADVALAVLAQLCEPSVGSKPQYPLLESVRMTADALLHYKGLQRWGRERRLLQERVAEEMGRLQRLQFDVERYPVWNAATQEWETSGMSWKGDRLFDIVEVELYQESLSGERERVEVCWLVRAGQWARWWLNAQGRVWIGHLARVLLTLDHRASRGAAVMAKKIGQRMLLLGEALRLGIPITRRIDHILEDIGELPTPAHRTKHWAGRTRERFDAALLLLQDLGVFAALAWPDGYGPGDAERSKGWVERWLPARVQMTLAGTPPPLALSAAAPAPEMARQPPPRRAARAPQPTVEGATIRQTRQERGWSQEALAHALGISVPYLSQIETGKRVPSPKLTRKLVTWIQRRA
jgi:DNA-binding XRE family transcriptional regulator